jgi:FkbM family methyltransferase
MNHINKIPFFKNKFNSLLRKLFFKINHEDTLSLVTDFFIKNNSEQLIFNSEFVLIKNFSIGFIEISEIFLRRNSSDLYVFYQIFIQKEYDPLFDIFKNNFDLKDNLKIIDLGGNIGLTSIYASIVFPNSEIIIVEPSKSNFDVLTKNCEAITRKYPQTKFIKLNNGVWKKKCKLKISNNNVDSWAIQVKEDENGEIDAISMNDLILKMPQIDILKIDIEGSEFEIINESTNCDWLLNIKVIAIEVHPKLGNSANIFKSIISYGFIYCGSVSETAIFLNKAK